MGLKAIPPTEVFALIDEATLRRTLEQVEQLRASSEGDGFCYGAVVTLEVVPEHLRMSATHLHACCIRAGGWTADLPPSTRTRGGLPA
jgi:hypothetical protein